MVLVAAIASGLIAGVFLGFSVGVMPALKQVDDKVFIDVMQRINRVIGNGLFGLTFLVSMLTALAIPVIDLVNGGGVDAAAVIGAVLVVLSHGFTFGGNFPLNARLEAAGPVARQQNSAEVRQTFEAPWNRWHNLRGLAVAVGFILLCVSASS
ncbi:DUF1772 domain-containing protein [Alloactinosynnema sp. L-07]|uniref:anthrone oxygenase family protein n=1 Tax=Alloactinosynnema sp. L-07 TaxID=1653480 RepID=UPI00155F58A2|nr:anthrone oxygenase family protein [Alloactinosynnema sp. L-07]